FARYYASADNSSSGKLSGQVYESKDTIYEIGKLSDKWKRINIKGGDLAFWFEAIQAAITVNSTCNIKANYSLKALSNSLLIGIRDKQMVEEKEITISGEKALESIYFAKMDNDSVKLCAVVMKNNTCIYDFTYTSPPDKFDSGLSEFKNFLSQFRVIK
ncbi:MAG TPA: hypothetical protein VI935_10025, partial [Thermodesulfobacteriota bacterium]|nr:hypothetical protein [Thermodesulfobacteriota bacterium]